MTSESSPNQSGVWLKEAGFLMRALQCSRGMCCNIRSHSRYRSLLLQYGEWLNSMASENLHTPSHTRDFICRLINMIMSQANKTKCCKRTHMIHKSMLHVVSMHRMCKLSFVLCILKFTQKNENFVTYWPTFSFVKCKMKSFWTFFMQIFIKFIVTTSMHKKRHEDEGNVKEKGE